MQLTWRDSIVSALSVRLDNEQLLIFAQPEYATLQWASILARLRISTSTLEEPMH